MAVVDQSVESLRGALSIEGVRAARDIVYEHLSPTPLMRHPLLCDALGIDLWLKHENHNPTGAFKIRGGLNYMHHLPAAERAWGVVTATRGNHGQSIGMAAQIHGVRCVVVVPRGNNPEKNAAMRAFGVELIEHGKDFDEAREHCELLSQRDGLVYVHSGDEPHLIHGVGTYSLEILEQLPEIDAILVPVGGGSAIAGAIVVFRALKPSVRIIGVQAENAPAVYQSWKTGTRVATESSETIADGLATRAPFDLPLSMMREGLDDFVLASEGEIRAAMRLLVETTHNLAEGAGAAATAAAKKLAPQLRGKRTVAVLSGANVDMGTLKSVLA